LVPTHQCDCGTNSDLLIPCEPTTEVYWNDFDQVVIRQLNWPDEDCWVVLNHDSIPALIARLQQMLNEGPE